jgi:hypothetical protein
VPRFIGTPCKGQHVSDPHVGVAASTRHMSGVSARDAPTVPLIPRYAPSRRPCERFGSSAEHPSALGLRPDVPTGVATQVKVVDMDDAEPRQPGGTAGALEAAHRGARLGNLFSSVANGRIGTGFGGCCWPRHVRRQEQRLRRVCWYVFSGCDAQMCVDGLGAYRRSLAQEEQAGQPFPDQPGEPHCVTPKRTAHLTSDLQCVCKGRAQ